jgi:hypothetical protein
MERAKAIAADPHGLTPVGAELKARVKTAMAYGKAVRAAKHFTIF